MRELLKDYLEQLSSDSFHRGWLSAKELFKSVFLVQHKDTLINFGLFSTRERAEKYIGFNGDKFSIQEVEVK